MSMAPYTYSVIRYVHDPATGERLNIGVILCAPTLGFVDARLEYRYERLSDAFIDFDGDHYRRTLRQFSVVVNALRNRISDTTLFDMWDLPSDVSKVADQIWADKDLSFQIGEVMAGMTDNPVTALELLFYRNVTSQYDHLKVEKRTDDEVWSVYQAPLIRRKVVRKLRPMTLVTPEVELKFEHAFRNDKWHILQPISMDYAKKESIQIKATRWLGNAVALEDEPTLQTLYILLGPPLIDAYRPAYLKAKNLLHRMPIKHELIEENEAEDFAEHIATFIKKHDNDE